MPSGPSIGRTALVGALAHTVYRRLEWLELALAVDLPVIEARVPLELSFLDLDEAEEVASFRTEIDAAEVRNRFARGDRCFGARFEGELASITWIATTMARIDYLGLALKLPAGIAYQYDRWTHPDLRGLRIAPASGSQLHRGLAREGFGTLAAAVLVENRAAMANALRAGLLPVATIGWIGIGPLRRPFRRSR
jgi:hypothetical protein